MALIKCKECNNEISDKAEVCPNCGCNVVTSIICDECGGNYSSTEAVCPSCGYPNDKKGIKNGNESMSKVKNSSNNAKKTNNKIFGIILIILGIVSIIWGLTLDYSGISSANQSYGGAAYTGIQNAASVTANNVQKLGITICSGLKGTLFVIGSVIVVKGAYIFNKDKFN